MRHATARGLRFSKVVSYGNASDINECDLLDYLAWDPETKVIAMSIEGLKDGPYPKVSLGDIKPRRGTVMSDPGLKELVAYVEKEVAVERALGSLPGLDCHKCGLDCRSMARAVVEGRRSIRDCRELPSRGVVVTVGGRRLATGTFVSEIVDDTVRGMLGSLKGYEPGKDVEIRLTAKSAESKRRPHKRR